jgi:hypothetical protein
MKQHPTKEQWQEIEKKLSSLFDGVYLRCDGFVVYASLVRASMTRLCIQPYVDGVLAGAWFLSAEDGTYPEQAVRFYRPVDKWRYQPKFVKGMEKAIGKRRCQAEGYYDKRRYYMTTWGAPAAFIRHLKVNNERIEVIDRETHDREVAAKGSQQEAFVELLTDAQA